MPVYIGVDFHTRTPTVCWCHTATGECGKQELENGDLEEVRRFYQIDVERQCTGRNMRFSRARKGNNTMRFATPAAHSHCEL
jgi:hypothetical protein